LRWHWSYTAAIWRMDDSQNDHGKASRTFRPRNV